MFETIAFDAASSGTNGGTTSVTFSHTCSGVSRALFVFVQANSSSTITGVTYNGVAMTKTTTVGSDSITVWTLLSPSTGANNVVVNFNTSVSARCLSASYTGVKQSATPTTTQDTNEGVTVTVNRSITTVQDNSWVLAFLDWDISGGATQFATAGATQRVSFAESGVGPNSMGLYDSNAPKTPAGAYNMQFNRSAGSGTALLTMYEIAPNPKNTGASLMAQMVG